MWVSGLFSGLEGKNNISIRSTKHQSFLLPAALHQWVSIIQYPFSIAHQPRCAYFHLSIFQKQTNSHCVKKSSAKTRLFFPFSGTVLFGTANNFFSDFSSKHMLCWVIFSYLYYLNSLSPAPYSRNHGFQIPFILRLTICYAAGVESCFTKQTSV